MDVGRIVVVRVPVARSVRPEDIHALRIIAERFLRVQKRGAGAFIYAQKPFLCGRPFELQLVGIACNGNEFRLQPLNDARVVESEPTAPLTVVSSAALWISHHYP